MTDPQPSFASRLTRFSLGRRVTVLVLFVTLVVVGIIATISIPLELFPRGYVGHFLYVYVPWNNAPTQEVMEKITLPLEEELSTIKGLHHVNSWTGTGGASVYMQFKQGTDMDVAYREVRDRVERAKALFPNDADRAFIRKDDPSNMPVAFIGIIIDPSVLDYYNLLEKEVILPLERIDGVAQVEKNGLEEKEILIEIDKEKADAYGLNLYEMTRNLQGDNFTMASGHVRDAGKKFILRSVATYKSLEELENRKVTPYLRVKDVATIKFEEPDKRYSVRVNGKPALALGVMKEGEANTVDLCREIKKTVARIQKNPRLAGIELQTIFNQGDMVEQSIGNLLGNGRIGGFFAAVVLFIFLRRFRMTLIIALAIPLSMLIALIVMYFAGETLNILTMLGLVICVGLLVDNSVVVAENIFRFHKDGLPRREACVRGAGEIALAITMATLTTVIVFLPIALVEGEGQFFLIRLALPISVSLIASLAVALIFIPLCVYLTLPRNGGGDGASTFVRAHLWVNDQLRRFYDAVFGRLNHFYNHCLAFFLRRRLDLVILLIVIFGVTQVVAFKKVKISDTQDEDRSGFRIGVDLSNEYDFESTKAYFLEAEKVIQGMKDELGLKGWLIVHFNDGGRIEGWMDENKPDKPLAKESARKLAEALPERAGVKLYYDQENRNKDEKGPAVFTVRLLGDDATILRDVADQLEPLFLQVDGVIGMRMGDVETPNELGLVLDRERVNSSGVNPEIIAGIIGYSLRGQQLTKYHYQGREVPVRVRYEEEDRRGLDNLLNFAIPTGNGGFLPMSALADAEMLQTPRGIFRREKKITHALTLELDRDRADETRDRLIALQRSLDLPEGISFDYESYSSRNEDIENLKFAGMLSIIFIYLLMGFLFESFILPLSIILTIPLASIGVGWIHFITGKNIDVLGVVGAILLIGVVVNNGIVLIDYVNRLRQEGLERSHALLKAADRRFRPIVMTALTTIIGMVPLTISRPNDMGLSYKSFGLTLIGGMTTATLLTLLVVPVFYTFFDDLRHLMARAMKRVVAGKQSASATQPASAK